MVGVLGIRQVSPGSLVTPTTVIATLDDIEHMHIDFHDRLVPPILATLRGDMALSYHISLA